MRLKALITAYVLILTAAAPLIADRGMGSIDLTANPSSLAADGKSVATVSAQVRDRDGKLVLDGVEIRFTTSLGIIEEAATTTAGVARVKLTSTDIAGTAIVTATWPEGQTVAQLAVVFGEGVSITGPEYISIDGDYVAYSMDHLILEALGEVRLSYRSLELEAHEVQIDLETGKLVAQWQGRDRPVKITAAGNTIEGNLFSLDLFSQQGMLLSTKTGGVMSVDLSKGTPEMSEGGVPHTPEEFDTSGLMNSSLFVRASHATIFLHDKIQFRRATIYINGKRVLTLPNYLLSLTGMPADGEQYVGYSTSGLTLNLPVYYSLNPNSSGAFLIRHGDKIGWGDYGQKPGWFVDVRQKYQTDRSQGQIVLNQVTGDDWGAQFSHNQSLGNKTQAFVYLDYPAHEAFYGALNLNRSFNQFNLGLNFYGNKYDKIGQESLAGDLNFRTHPRQIGGSNWRYTFTGRAGETLSYTTLMDDEGKFTEKQSQQVGSRRLAGNIYSPSMRLSSNLSARTTAGLGYAWEDAGVSGLSTQLTAVLDWKIAKYGNLQMNYRFVDKPSVYVTRILPPTETTPEQQIRQELAMRRQSLSATLRLSDGQRWSAMVYGIKGLDHPAANIFADFSYRLDKNWRVGIRSTYSDFGYASYDDLEISLGRMLGTREIMAIWSKSQDKIMFELGSGRF